MDWQDPLRKVVFTGLYDHIFSSPRFEYWHSKDCNSQLRVYGGPGSGKASFFFTHKPGVPSHIPGKSTLGQCKTQYPARTSSNPLILTCRSSCQTTLLRLAASKLQATYRGYKDAVAHVFLQPHVDGARATSVLTQVLQSILVQLSSNCTISGNEQCPPGKLQREQGDLDSLYAALVERIGHLDNAFLIIDGLDWCSVGGVQGILESQLVVLQTAGLKIMASTRGLCLLPPDEVYWGFEYECDGKPNCGDVTSGLFWVCALHEKFTLCASCRSEGLYCTQW